MKKKQLDEQNMEVILPSKEEKRWCRQSQALAVLKRLFSRSPLAREALNKVRKEIKVNNKDGSISKQKRVIYQCNCCKEWFSSKDVQVDHINPVIPLQIPFKYLKIDTVLDRLFCDVSNLQVLCKPDHLEKSKLENQTRRDWLGKTKYIVYETTNKINSKRYYGIHKCEFLSDGYLGSGTLLRSAIQKYGTNAFSRVVLDVFDNVEDALAFEKAIITDEIIESDAWYNLAAGGIRPQKDTTIRSGKRVICHQTGEIFASMSEAARKLDVDPSGIIRALNDPKKTVKNVHFFTLDAYDPSIRVSFHKGEEIVCLTNKTHYSNIELAAEHTGVNYRVLRNSLSIHKDEALTMCCGLFFVYYRNYLDDFTYTRTTRKVKNLTNGEVFDSLEDAANAYYALQKTAKDIRSLKASIVSSCRKGTRVQGCKWEYMEVTDVIKKAEDPVVFFEKRK